MKALVSILGLLAVGVGFGQLTPDEAESLRFMREEEKLARDTYLKLYEIHGDTPFANIAQSEQRHMDSVLTLLIQYGLEDSAHQEVGIFNNAELQSLYDKLVSKGSSSRAAAFQVGILIEEKDIADLQAAMVATENPDLDRVFGRLLNGSYNHLQAFSGGLAVLAGFPDAAYLEGWFLTWLGWVRLSDYPWMQDVTGNWWGLFPVAGGLYLVMPSGLWVWTSPLYYPWVYSLSDGVWRGDGLPTP